MNESRTKLLIAVASAICATGLFLLAMGKRDAGGAIVLLGWSAFVVALHSFGRLGSNKADPDDQN